MNKELHKHIVSIIKNSRSADWGAVAIELFILKEIEKLPEHDDAWCRGAVNIKDITKLLEK